MNIRKKDKRKIISKKKKKKRIYFETTVKNDFLKCYSSFHNLQAKVL